MGLAAVVLTANSSVLVHPSAHAGVPKTTSALRVTPAKAVLIGPESVQQLVVETTDGQDVTDGVEFASVRPGIAVVDASGTISARGNGMTTVRVRQGAQSVDVPVTVRSFAPGPPINFTNQVVPIFTKLGCNSGGCHGKASGQNGFRLSLLGFEPELDYETLVLEGRGRRLFPAAPDHSLLLMKATARVPHGGGKKIDPGSHEYHVLRRWVASGMPIGRPDDPSLARIEVYPDGRVLDRGEGQQVLVTAVYSDGSTEDVTRWAQYESNEPEVADVEPGGRVATGALAGQAAIMARYQGQVTVFRATVPLGMEITDAPEFTPANVLDELAAKQWRRLGLAPSEVCTDAEFLRRASLDITGTLPSEAEVRAFVADDDPEKRTRLIDRLIARPEYASYFATKWADILRNKREGRNELQAGTYRFYDWIRSSLDRNVPYDEFARDVLAASGTPETAPPVLWYRTLRSPDAFVDDTAQVFLGMRLQCAKCHHHPFERWSEHDYYGFAAFFARIGRKPAPTAQSRRPHPGRGHLHSTQRHGPTPQDQRGDGAEGPGHGGHPRLPHRGPASEAGRLDGRSREPVLRPGAGEPLLGPLLRSGDRRAAG